MANNAEKRHLDRLGRMSCVLCRELGRAQEGRTFVHHIRSGQGISQRSPHWLAIPLCHDCHQGGSGLHGTKALLDIAKASELSLLAATIEQLMEGKKP